jgi:anti-sigma B factor antagonist
MESDFSTPFEMATEQQAHTTFVRLRGEFDLAGRERFRKVAESLGRSGLRRVVLDLRGLTFIDSSGLRWIIDLWKRSQDDGFDLTIVRGSPSIARVFELAGLDDVLTTVEDHSPVQDPTRSS